MTTDVISLGSDNTRVRFSVRWFRLLRVRGVFEEIDGALVEAVEGEVSVSVVSRSVNTGIRLRDRHLVRQRFLDGIAHPRIAFRGRIVRQANDSLVVNGTLYLRGHEMPLTLTPDLDAGPGRPRSRWSVAFRVPRHHFGIGVATGVARLNPLLWAIGATVDVRVMVYLPVTAFSAVSVDAHAR